MKRIKEDTYIGERALYMLENAEVFNCIFENGESPLKETRNLLVRNSEFRWKYPIWYSKDVLCSNIVFKDTARSGVWYTDNIEIVDSIIHAPKTFRRCSDVRLTNVKITNAQETLWKCRYVKLKDITANGDYFGFNSEDVEVDNLYLDGNYAFDGGKNIIVRNSVLNSKDSFWNVENLLVEDSFINGEYLAWNSKNVTFKNCKIISHQGLCYIDNVKLINCQLIDSDLCLELCSNIDAQITNDVESIKNPISGVIRVKSIKELILDEKVIDPNKTKIIYE